MNTRYIISGTILTLVLSASLGQAEPGRTIAVDLHIAGAARNGVIDVDDDSRLNTSLDGVGAAHLLDPFDINRFLFQEEVESSDPHTPCTLPDGSTGEERELVQARGILTRESNSDQLFLEANSQTLCINTLSRKLTFVFRGRFTGGTGGFAGASGTWKEEGTGQGLVADPSGHFFGAFNLDLTGTLKLPPR